MSHLQGPRLFFRPSFAVFESFGHRCNLGAICHLKRDRRLFVCVFVQRIIVDGVGDVPGKLWCRSGVTSPFCSTVQRAGAGRLVAFCSTTGNKQGKARPSGTLSVRTRFPRPTFINQFYTLHVTLNNMPDPLDRLTRMLYWYRSQ